MGLFKDMNTGNQNEDMLRPAAALNLLPNALKVNTLTFSLPGIYLCSRVATSAAAMSVTQQVSRLLQSEEKGFSSMKLPS